MTIRRYEISDFEWAIISPLLPNKPRGVARVEDRKVLNGIYWRLRTGSPRVKRSSRLLGPSRKSAPLRGLFGYCRCDKARPEKWESGWDFALDTDDAQSWIQEGISFVSIGNDVSLLASGARALLSTVAGAAF